MADYFSTPTQDDVANFLKDQQAVRGDEFEVPTLDDTVASRETLRSTSKSSSVFSMYREALGADIRLELSTGEFVTVGKPKVKSIKYLLTNIETIQKKAETADKNPLAALEEFEKIMLDCLRFDDAPTKTETIDKQAWFDDLPSDDGFLIIESFSKVFDIQYLLSRAAGNSGKK